MRSVSDTLTRINQSTVVESVKNVLNTPQKQVIAALALAAILGGVVLIVICAKRYWLNRNVSHHTENIVIPPPPPPPGPPPPPLPTTIRNVGALQIPKNPPKLRDHNRPLPESPLGQPNNATRARSSSQPSPLSPRLPLFQSIVSTDEPSAGTEDLSHPVSFNEMVRRLNTQGGPFGGAPRRND